MAWNTDRLAISSGLSGILHPTEETQLEAIPGHYKSMLDWPF
jgi:hypothetical protein